MSPITSILQEVAYAHAGIGNGIETYPLSEYIMQSVFLRMTGFQEQKMKCICWDVATNDYKYRYEKFGKGKMGECSHYDEKSEIYKDLIKQIKKHRLSFDVSIDLGKNKVKTDTFDFIKNTFSTSNLSACDQRNLREFIKEPNILDTGQFAAGNTLLQTSLHKKYTQMYEHRNRCAHNTQSYQENLPTLKTLVDADYKYDNYFVRFAILILLDNIFMELYNIYVEVVEENFV